MDWIVVISVLLVIFLIFQQFPPTGAVGVEEKCDNSYKNKFKKRS